MPLVPSLDVPGQPWPTLFDVSRVERLAEFHVTMPSLTLDHLAVPVDLSFGLQPVFEFMAGSAAARLIKFIGASCDLILIVMVFSR